MSFTQQFLAEASAIIAKLDTAAIDKAVTPSLPTSRQASTSPRSNDSFAEYSPGL